MRYPAAATAATAGIKFIQSNKGKARCDSLWRRVKQLSPKSSSPIIPLIVGNETEAVKLAIRLREKNIFIPAIRYPTVGRGEARLRITLTAAHTAKDVSELLAALDNLNLKIENAHTRQARP